MILMYFMYYVILSSVIIFMYNIPLWCVNNSEEVQIVSCNCACSISFLQHVSAFLESRLQAIKNTQRTTIEIQPIGLILFQIPEIWPLQK